MPVGFVALIIDVLIGFTISWAARLGQLSAGKNVKLIVRAAEPRSSSLTRREAHEPGAGFAGDFRSSRCSVSCACFPGPRSRMEIPINGLG
jgi:hypothetical protein